MQALQSEYPSQSTPCRSKDEATPSSPEEIVNDKTPSDACPHLKWLERVFIPDDEVHPSLGLKLTTYLRLINNLIDMSGYPLEDLGPLNPLGDNGEGMELLAARFNLPIDIIEKAKGAFQKSEKVQQNQKLVITIQRFFQKYREEIQPWPFEKITLCGGGDPLTNQYFVRLCQRENFKKLDKSLLDLLFKAIDARSGPSLDDLNEKKQDSDIHCFYKKESSSHHKYGAKKNIEKVVYQLAQESHFVFPEGNFFTNSYSPKNAPQTHFFTLGQSNHTLDLIHLPYDPGKIPYQFTRTGLEFTLDIQNLTPPVPECLYTNSWACIFHQILQIGWLANYQDEAPHPAMNAGLLTRIGIEKTKGTMILQPISQRALVIFLQEFNIESCKRELLLKLRHLPSEQECHTAFLLNVLDSVLKYSPSSQLLEVFPVLFPEIKKDWFSLRNTVLESILIAFRAFPAYASDILNIIKGAIFCCYVNQRLSPGGTIKEAACYLNITDGAPSISYPIKGNPKAQFTFNITPNLLDDFVKTIQRHHSNENLIQCFKVLYLSITRVVVETPLYSSDCLRGLKEEFLVLGFDGGVLQKFYQTAIGSNLPLLADTALDLYRLTYLLGIRVTDKEARSLLNSSLTFRVSQRIRSKRFEKNFRDMPVITYTQLPELRIVKNGLEINRELIQLQSKISEDLLADIEHYIYSNHSVEARLDLLKNLIKKLTTKVALEAFNSSKVNNSIRNIIGFLAENQKTVSCLKILKWYLNQPLPIPCHLWFEFLKERFILNSESIKLPENTLICVLEILKSKSAEFTWEYFLRNINPERCTPNLSLFLFPQNYLKSSEDLRVLPFNVLNIEGSASNVSEVQGPPHSPKFSFSKLSKSEKRKSLRRKTLKLNIGLGHLETIDQLFSLKFYDQYTSCESRDEINKQMVDFFDGLKDMLEQPPFDVKKEVILRRLRLKFLEFVPEMHLKGISVSQLQPDRKECNWDEPPLVAFIELIANTASKDVTGYLDAAELRCAVKLFWKNAGRPKLRDQFVENVFKISSFIDSSKFRKVLRVAEACWNFILAAVRFLGIPGLVVISTQSFLALGDSSDELSLLKDWTFSKVSNCSKKEVEWPISSNHMWYLVYLTAYAIAFNTIISACRHNAREVLRRRSERT